MQRLKLPLLGPELLLLLHELIELAVQDAEGLRMVQVLLLEADGLQVADALAQDLRVGVDQAQGLRSRLALLLPERFPIDEAIHALQVGLGLKVRRGAAGTHSRSAALGLEEFELGPQRSRVVRLSHELLDLGKVAFGRRD